MRCDGSRARSSAKRRSPFLTLNCTFRIDIYLFPILSCCFKTETIQKSVRLSDGCMRITSARGCGRDGGAPRGSPGGAQLPGVSILGPRAWSRRCTRAPRGQGVAKTQVKHGGGQHSVSPEPGERTAGTGRRSKGGRAHPTRPGAASDDVPVPVCASP